MMNTGSIVMFAGSVAPQGWLLCDGTAVSRSIYSALFDIVGTTYGEGDGSSTFNLPDLNGRVVMGSSSSHPSATTGGEETHALTSQEIPNHNHTVGQHGHSNEIEVTTPVLSHTVTQAAFTYYGPNGYNNKAHLASGGTIDNILTSASNANATRSTDAAIADHQPTDCIVSGSVEDCQSFDTESIGLGNSHNNMQPYITLNYIIYAGE